MTKKINDSYSFSGAYSVPGDKSVAQRAVIISSIAEGVSTVLGFPEALDCLSALECMRNLGADIIKNGSELVINGSGLYGLKQYDGRLNAGNSATTMRLLSGVLSAQRFDSVITGDESLLKRSANGIIKPLSQMGADVCSETGDGFAPLIIKGRALKAIAYDMPVASAQVKSAVLLAGLYAEGSTCVRESFASRNHTEIMLGSFGAQIESKRGRVTLYRGGCALRAKNVAIYGDFSSAAYLIASAVIHNNSSVRINGVFVNKTRTGFLNVLRRMGAKIRLMRMFLSDGEPVADIVAESSGLFGTEVSAREIPSMIDEIPILAVVSCFAKGRTVIKGASELRKKECDRLAAMACELKKAGADIEETDDGLIIEGGKKLKSAVFDTHKDHRVEMSLSVLGTRIPGGCEIENAGYADVSFPGFYDIIDRA